MKYNNMEHSGVYEDAIDILEQRLRTVEDSIMSDVDVPELTEDKEINNQLIKYFWALVLLTFISQLIGFLVQFLSGTITIVVLGILALGSINTLLIGGGVRLVQKQIQSISNKYNQSVQQKKVDNQHISKLQKENDDLKKQLNNRDAELISLKVVKE